MNWWFWSWLYSTTHLWWFWGWFTIGFTTLLLIYVQYSGKKTFPKYSLKNIPKRKYPKYSLNVFPKCVDIPSSMTGPVLPCHHWSEVWQLVITAPYVTTSASRSPGMVKFTMDFTPFFWFQYIDIWLLENQLQHNMEIIDDNCVIFILYILYRYVTCLVVQ